MTGDIFWEDWNRTDTEAQEELGTDINEAVSLSSPWWLGDWETGSSR